MVLNQAMSTTGYDALLRDALASKIPVGIRILALSVRVASRREAMPQPLRNSTRRARDAIGVASHSIFCTYT